MYHIPFLMKQPTSSPFYHLSLLVFPRYRPCHSKRSGPRCLKIKAARDAIDVEHLTGKEQPRHHPALQRIGMNTLQRHTAAGDKLFLEGGTGDDLIAVVTQGVHQTVLFFFTELATPHIHPLPDSLRQQIVPQTLRKTERIDVGEMTLGIVGKSGT